MRSKRDDDVPDKFRCKEPGCERVLMPTPSTAGAVCPSSHGKIVALTQDDRRRLARINRAAEEDRLFERGED